MVVLTKVYALEKKFLISISGILHKKHYFKEGPNLRVQKEGKIKIIKIIL